MSLQPLSKNLPGLRPLTVQEQLRRAAALACVNSPAKPNCKRNISIGIFFDGTNNNKKRDQEDISDPLKRSHTNMGIRAIRWLLQSLCLCGLLLLGACEAKPPKEETYPASMAGANYTREGIQEFYVDGAWGGVIGSYSGGGVGGVCCVTLPMKWRPGLDAEVEWRIGHFQKDGRFMTAEEKAAMPIDELIEKYWTVRHLKRRVPIEPYKPEGGSMQVIFLPNDEVKIYVSNWAPYSPNHPGYHLWQQSERDPQRIQFEAEQQKRYEKEGY